MPDRLGVMVPVQWQPLVDVLAAPLAWIPGMQRDLLGFVLVSASGWTAVTYYLLLLFPSLLWLCVVWCTMLSLYTLPFRSGRVEFIRLMLLAWWDAALAGWMFWVGLARFVVVVVGWIFTLARLALKLLVEVGRQVVSLPFTVTGQIAQSYFQPGVPWVAFLMVVFWSLLEATIFTYVLLPNVSEVLAGIVGAQTPSMTGPLLFVFLFLLILGSFACLQVLADAIKVRQYKFLVQMLLVELFVMTFEVMFLYRELVDAITPWIAQQTSEQFRPGIGFTLSLAMFGWLGIRGMTWFLFGQFGTPPLLAFISRRPMIQSEGEGATASVPAESRSWWRAPMEEFKQEVGWLEGKAGDLMEYLTLPYVHVIAAALNLAMILVASKPVFSVPCKSLKEVLDVRGGLSAMPLQPKKLG